MLVRDEYMPVTVTYVVNRIMQGVRTNKAVELLSSQRHMNGDYVQKNNYYYISVLCTLFKTVQNSRRV